MSNKVINYSSAVIQFSMSIFLLIWLIKELNRIETDTNDLTFPIGEYNGQLGASEPMFNVPVYVIVIPLLLFTLITGGVHIFYARSGPGYQARVRRGINSMRWVEYSITATIMLLVVAMTSGVASFDALLLMTISTMCCMICGYISEQTAISKRKVSILSTIVGWLLLVGVFSIIIRRFYSIVSQTSGNGEEGPPSWVWGIVIGMTLLFTSFGFIHLVHMRKQWSGKGASESFNKNIESAYTITSMISKTLLVFLLASGLFARSVAEQE